MAVGGLVAVLQPATASASGKTSTVIMKSISYDPKQIEITVGDSVVWENKSFTDHSATANDGKSFDTGLIAPNAKSKPVIFEAPGRFEYHCSIHGKSMSAFITVKGK